MATSKDYKEFILEQLSLLEDIECKTMMGEYLLYYKKVLFGGIYDNRLLIKKTTTNEKYNLPDEIPYETAKPMFMIEDLDDKEQLREIIIATYEELVKRKK